MIYKGLDSIIQAAPGKFNICRDKALGEVGSQPLYQKCLIYGDKCNSNTYREETFSVRYLNVEKRHGLLYCNYRYFGKFYLVIYLFYND